MRIFRACFAAAVMLTVAACADEDHRAFDSAVNEASAEVANHHAFIFSSSTMAIAHDELVQHGVEIDADMRHIRSHLDDLDWFCDDRDLDRVWDEVYAIEDRIDLYLYDSGRMADMSSLRIVCESYAHDMGHMFDELRYLLNDAECW